MVGVDADDAAPRALADERPELLLAELTHRCPLHCPYCSNPQELIRGAQELTTQEWIRVLEEAAALDGASRLRSIQRADRISIADPGRWRLHNVATTRFGPDQIQGESATELTMRSTVNPEFLGLAATDPDLLTLRGLSAYIDHLRRNNLDTAVFEIGFWSRIARMFAVVVVTLLALPFVFGPLRTSGAGTRTVVGVLLGVVFFLITRTVENGGQLFGLNAVLVGWLPTGVIALCTAVAISRTR